jgi:hypothetical protein
MLLPQSGISLRISSLRLRKDIASASSKVMDEKLQHGEAINKAREAAVD